MMSLFLDDTRQLIDVARAATAAASSPSAIARPRGAYWLMRSARASGGQATRAAQQVQGGIHGGQGLVRDEGPRGLVEVRELGATQLLAGEALARLVDVHARNFKHPVGGRERVDARQLLGGVARGAW